MGHQVFNEFFNCGISIGACFVLSVAYIASLYIWNSPHNRDHPSTIKRRFLSVFCMMFISPAFVYIAIHKNTLDKATLWEILGLKTTGLIQATVIPLLLTMVLFMGPLSMHALNGLWKIYAEPGYWTNSMKNLIWWRNHVVAPLSEEFTFRACMLPILLQCFHPITATFVCPLFFGVAHFHHMTERVKSGIDFKTALIISCFQFSYTTVFGAYSAYLFVRTGHLMSSFIAHSFCNLMGFPDVNEISGYKGLHKILIIVLFVVGLVAWCMLLSPLTNPHFYNNELFWINEK